MIFTDERRRRGTVLVTPAINMTAAASGSNGITVADDDDIDFGTGDFFVHWEGSLPDWTPNSGAQDLINKLSASVGYRLTIGSTSLGFPIVFLNATAYAASITNTIVNGAIAKITAVIARETASAAGSVTFYINGTQHGTAVAITAGVPATISNAVAAYVSGTSTARTASNTISCIVGNFAPTAAEVLDLCTNGIPESWKWGGQAALTTGTWSNFGGGSGFETFTSPNAATITSAINTSGLGIASVSRAFVSGKKYRVRCDLTINSISGALRIAQALTTDLSVNQQIFQSFNAIGTYTVDAEIDASISGTRLGFVTQDASTTVNFSVANFYVYQIGATMALLPNAIHTSGATAWDDSSGNTGGGTLPAAGATKVTIRR